MTENLITIKTPSELDRLRHAGKILAAIAKDIQCSLKIGMTTQMVDALAEELMRQAGAVPAFKGYRGFPAAACISLNQEVVHGIPGSRVIMDGDIVSIDVGIIVDEFYSDTAFSVGMGKIDASLKKLLEVTQQSLAVGIARVKAGNHLSDVSHAIQRFVEANRFSVVRDFVGHGIGRKLHEDPEIPNFGPPHQGPVLKEGMVLAIEPMVNLGSWPTKVLPDGWTVVTADGKPSAHFEHTVAVTNHGPEILTQ